MATIIIDAPLAAALNRIRRKIPLSQLDLANRAEVAQGTVSNFLRGKGVRRDFAGKILDVLETAIRNASLSSRTQKTFLDTISRAKKVLSGEMTYDHQFGNPEGSGWEPGDFFAVLMALTDSPRLNLTKAFDYRNDEHFKAHIECVRRGVTYKWVAYDSDMLQVEWSEYISDVRELLMADQVNSRKVRRKISDADKGADIRLEEQLQCHVLPKGDEIATPPIPFRITVFGNDVCLCSEERDPNAYRYGVRYFVLGAAESTNLRDALGALFDVCPSISEPRDQALEVLKRCHKYHDLVRSAFLQALVSKFGS